MERERIERLAMDEALGELNEDAAALLHTYLAEHGEADRWAGGIRQTCHKVQRVVQSRTASTPAELRVTPRASRMIGPSRWLAPARWAAVVMLTLLLGLQLGRRWQAEPPAAPPLVPVQTTQAEQRGWEPAAPGQPSGFWQAKATALRGAKPSARDSRDMRGDLWEKYRQYLKEHQHG